MILEDLKCSFRSKTAAAYIIHLRLYHNLIAIYFLLQDKIKSDYYTTPYKALISYSREFWKFHKIIDYKIS